MFILAITEAGLGPAREFQARCELARVIEQQCVLRCADLVHRAEVLRSAANLARRPDRRRDLDIERTERRLRFLLATAKRALETAGPQLAALLRLVGGPLAGIDLGGCALGARVAGSPVRALLLPEPLRRARVQLQIPPSGVLPPGIAQARQVCLGAQGDAFVDEALDRADLRTWALTLVSYVRTN
jgi:hypothetical protein